MPLLVIMAVITLAQAASARAPLDLMPILRDSQPRTIQDNLENAREIIEPPTTSEHHNNNQNAEIDDAILRGDVENDVVRNNKNGGRDVFTLTAPYNKYNTEKQQVKDILNSIVYELISQFLKYELNKKHQERQRQSEQPSRFLSKRLWGQRRNVQTRFASFGSKLTPNRKVGLGSSGSTLLRYGRSTRQK